VLRICQEDSGSGDDFVGQVGNLRPIGSALWARPSGICALPLMWGKQSCLQPAFSFLPYLDKIRNSLHIMPSCLGFTPQGDTLAKSKNDVLQGTLDLLVLKTLQRGPMHGYGIASHIERISNELLRVEEGSLYPALHRMEQDDWISAEWKASETGRQAKFYRITRSGRAQLAKEEDRWQNLAAGVERLLRLA
jgi:PadR family transcriptional regulator PadR